jgi:hypothetical protein
MWIMDEKGNGSRIKRKCEERMSYRNGMEIGLCKRSCLLYPYLSYCEWKALSCTGNGLRDKHCRRDEGIRASLEWSIDQLRSETLMSLYNADFCLFDTIFRRINKSNRFCGAVIRVPGYKSKGTGSIPGATRFSEKLWVWNRVYTASLSTIDEHLKGKVAAPV